MCSVQSKLYRGRVMRKGAFEHAQSAYSDHPTHAQSITLMCSLVIHSIVSNDYVSGQ